MHVVIIVKAMYKVMVLDALWRRWKAFRQRCDLILNLTLKIAVRVQDGRF